MQHRKLSDEERAFIESKLVGREDVELEDTDDGDLRFTDIEPEPEKRRNIFTSIYLWITVVMSIPVLLVAAFSVFIVRIAAVFGGTEVLDAIVEEGVPQEAEQLLNEAGISWFPQFLEVYEMRWFLGAGTFTVFLVIAGIMFFIDLYRTKK